MRFKKILSICKNAGQYIIHDDLTEDGELLGQWFGMGGALYALTDSPYLTIEYLVMFLGLTDKQLDKIQMKHEKSLPVVFSFKDNGVNEKMIDRKPFTFISSGRTVRPIETKNGLEFVDDDLLAPFEDVSHDVEIYERTGSSNNTYFAVKMGLILVGVIAPMNVISEEFVTEIETLASRCRKALINKNVKEGD